VPKQNIYYYFSSLKKKNLIDKIGKVWQINTLEASKNLSKAYKLKSDDIRGHAFIWKIRGSNIKNIDWKYFLNEKKIDYDEMGLSGTPRIILEDRKIWLGKKHIIIYFNEEDSFFAKNSLESRKLAIYSLLQTIKQLEAHLGIQIKKIEFTIAREHFPMIKNLLAIQCNNKGEKINISNKHGIWLSVDDSLGLGGELEILGSPKNLPMETSMNMQKWWNNQKETGFKVTPSFLLESMNKVTENQMMFAKNIETHMKVLTDIGDAVNDLKKEVKKMNIQNQINAQSKIGDFL
jgi:hypothetical protein